MNKQIADKKIVEKEEKVPCMQWTIKRGLMYSKVDTHTGKAHRYATQE